MPETAVLLDVHGRAITHAQVRQSLRVTVLASSFGTIWMAMTLTMPINLFMEAVGASGVLIGLLTTVRLFAAGMQVPAALISEKIGSRKRFMVASGIVHRMLWFVVAALALCWKPSAWWLLPAVIATVGISDLAGNVTSVTWLSWMTDLVPSRSGGAFWGQRQTIVTIAGLGGMGLAGWLMDTFQTANTGKTSPLGFALVFAIAATCGVTDIALHVVPREPMPGPRAPHRSVWQRLAAPLGNSNFRVLIGSMGVWTFCSTMIVTFCYVYLKRYFPVTYSDISWLGIANALGTAAAGVFIGSLLDRFGARKMTALLLAIAPLTLAAWFFVDATFVTLHLPKFGQCTFAQAVFLLAPAMFLNGGVFNSMFACQMRLIAEITSVSGRTVWIGLYWASVNILGALGSLSGGFLMDWFTAHPVRCTLHNGTGFSFFHVIIVLFTLLLWLVSIPLFLWGWTKKSGEAAHAVDNSKNRETSSVSGVGTTI